MSSGKGRVGAGANAMKSVTAASASETPWPSASLTGTVPPEVQSVSYDECKFHTYHEGGCTHGSIWKPICCSGERGALPPGSRGIQTVERKFAAGESWLGIPSSLSPRRRIFLTRSRSIRPEWKSVRVSGGCVGKVHCGVWGVCARMVGCERADISRENAERRPFKQVPEIPQRLRLAKATTALITHGFHARPCRRHFGVRLDNAVVVSLTQLWLNRLMAFTHPRSLIPWRGRRTTRIVNAFLSVGETPV
jgi:hypothetical protein